MRTFLAAPPVSAFAMVMGLSGLSLTWSKFSHVSQLPLAQDIALAFGLLAIVVFLTLALGLLRKQLQTPEKSSKSGIIRLSLHSLAPSQSVFVYWLP